LRKEQRGLRELFEQQENERQQWSREVDGAILAPLRGAIEELEQSRAAGLANSAAQLARAAALLRDAIAESERLRDAVRPAALDAGGLVMAIQELVNNQAAVGRQITFHHEVAGLPL